MLKTHRALPRRIEALPETNLSVTHVVSILEGAYVESRLGSDLSLPQKPAVCSVAVLVVKIHEHVQTRTILKRTFFPFEP